MMSPTEEDTQIEPATIPRLGPWITSGMPALVLAPMEGVTDAPMRALQGETGAFSYAVSEFLRVATHAIPSKVFARDVPELLDGAMTSTGLPVQVQILGGDPERMAQSALNAVRAGARSIDVNFGCPAKTVNRNDGGASLLNHPIRIRAIVRAIRDLLPVEVPVSAKLRLGWDSIDDIDENAAMAAEGGASWITIHGRTRAQGYLPPIFWKPIGRVRESLGIPVVANGDIWSFDDFLRCRDETGCIQFMIGRGALANPELPYRIAESLGLPLLNEPIVDWVRLFEMLVGHVKHFCGPGEKLCHLRLKQWMKIANGCGNFPHFDELKRTESLPEFMRELARVTGQLYSAE